MTQTHWELLSRFRECATDWDGKQMPDLEPAKGDVTAGELRAAVDLIERLYHERRNIISHGIGGYTKAVDSMNMNAACVAISAFRSNLYEAGKEAGRAQAQENTNAD